MRLGILLLCTIMTGCISQQELARRQALAEQEYQARSQAYTHSLMQQCHSLGYQADTDAFRNCVLTLHAQNRQEAAQVRGIAVQEGLRRQYDQLPYCYTLPRGSRGMAQAQGSCR
jgi:hypothetical protein